MSINISLILNDSLEFPLWRPLVAVKLSLYWGVLIPITLFFNISLFVALVRSTMKHKPLLVLYGSLLLGLCVDKLLACLDESVTSPSSIGYCVCLELTYVLLSLPKVFFIVYSPIAVTCQSVLQLLIMKGRQQWQDSYKRSFGCLIVSLAVAAFWTVAYFIGNMLSKFPNFCHSFCQTPQTTNPFYLRSVDATLLVVVAYTVITLIPAFVVTVTTSIWAFLTFKKKFIATTEKDAILSRRIFFLPVIMVFLLFCNNFLSYVIVVVTNNILDRASLGPFFGNWANLLSTMLYLVLDILHALSYPLVLLFLHARLRKTWKSLFSCKKQSSDKNSSQQSNSLSKSSSQDTTLIFKQICKFLLCRRVE